MSHPFSEKNLEAALVLADVGFRVFPARAIYNPATQRWNKPPYIGSWQSMATTNPGQIGRWWHQYPDAIPAVICDDFVVIDADRHAGGPDGVGALAELAKLHGNWPAHPVVLTPTNGEHRYFRQCDPPLGNGTGILPQGIDVRGFGGFVIGAGAVLPDGRQWRISPAQSTGSPLLPAWLEQMLRTDRIRPSNDHGISNHLVGHREERYAEAVLQAGMDEIATATKGKRNIVLNFVAYRLGRMIARGWIDQNKVENCLIYAAFHLTNEDGLAAVMATIKSGIDGGCRKPHPDLSDRNGGGK